MNIRQRNNSRPALAIEVLESRCLLAFGVVHVAPNLASGNNALMEYRISSFGTDANGVPQLQNSIASFLYGFSRGSDDTPDPPGMPPTPPVPRNIDDIPIVGDWSGKGHTSVGAIQRGSGGLHRYLLDTDRDTTEEYRFRFGFQSDVPIVGDFDNQFGDDIAVIRDGQRVTDVPDVFYREWFVTTANSRLLGDAYPTDDSVSPIQYNFLFGLTEDRFLTGRFDSDSLDDIVAIRTIPNVGLTWYFYLTKPPTTNEPTPYPRYSDTQGLSIPPLLQDQVTFTFGTTGTPIVGDWDQDGIDDVGLIDSSGPVANWTIQRLAFDNSKIGNDRLQPNGLPTTFSFGNQVDNQLNSYFVGNWASNYWNGGGPALERGPAATGNVWSDADSWSLRRLPVAGETVVIDQPATVQITFDDGNFVGNLVTSNRLNVTGGRIELGGPSDLGPVVVSGGTLVASGSLDPSSFLQTSGVFEFSATNPLGGIPLTLSGGTIRSTQQQSTIAPNVTLNNTLNLTNTVVIDSVGDSYAILSGTINGTGTIEKSGTGFVYFINGTPSYTGELHSIQGTIIHRGGTAAGRILVNGGFLDLYSSDGSTTNLEMASGGVLARETASFNQVRIAGGTLEVNAQQSFNNLTITSGSVVVGYAARNRPFGATTPIVMSNGSLLSTIDASTPSPLEQFLIPNPIQISGTVSLGNSNTTTSTASGNYIIFSGTISGDGAIRKVGSGTLLLPNRDSNGQAITNTYTGETIIDDGEVVVESANSLGSATGGTRITGIGTNARLGLVTASSVLEPIVVSNQGRLDLRRTVSYVGTLELETGSQVLMENGVGLGGTVNVKGSTNVSAVANMIGSTSTVPPRISSSFEGVGTLTLQTLNGTPLEIAATNRGYSGSTSVLGNGMLRLQAANGLPVGMGLNVGTDATISLNRFNLTAPSILGSGQIDTTGAILALDGGSFAGRIIGTGSLRKQSNGQLTLSNANSYSGSTAILGGTLLIASSSVLPESTDVTLSSNGVFDLATFSQRIRSVEGSGRIQGSNNSRLTVNALVDSTFAGVFSGSISVRKEGTGTLNLSGSSSNSGLLALVAGTLRTIGNNVLSDLASIEVQSGATFDASGSNDTIHSLFVDSGGMALLGLTNQTTFQVASGVTNRAGGTMQTGSSRLRVFGDFDNAGTFGSTGGVLEMAGTQPIQNLRLGSSGLATLHHTGSQRLAVFASSPSVNLIGSLINDTGSMDIAGLSVTAATLQWNGGDLIGSSLSRLTINGDITLSTGALNVPIAGSGRLRKNGPGTAQISSSNSFSGGISVEQGILVTSVNNAVPAGSAIALASDGTLDVSNTTQTASNVTGAGMIRLGSSTLNINPNQPTSFSGTIVGTGTVNKQGPSEWVLSGSNTFAGPTNILAGILRTGAAETLSDNSAVTVASGASLLFGPFSETIASLNNSGQTQLSSLGNVSSRLRVLTNLQNQVGATFSGGASTIQVDGTTTNASTMNLQGSAFSTSTFVLQSGVVNSTSQNGLALPTGSLAASSSIRLESGTIDVQMLGNASLVKQTAGTVRLLRPNTYSATTTVTSGILSIEASNGLPATSSVVIDATGQLQFVSTSNTIASLSNSGQVQLSSDSSSRTRIIGSMQNQANGTIRLGAGTIELQANFVNAGLVQPDASTLDFVGDAGELQRLSMGSTSAFNNVAHRSASTIRLDSHVQVNGTLIQSGSGAIDVGSHTLNVGSLQLDGGTLRSGNDGTISSQVSPFELRQGIVDAVLSGNAGLRKSSSGRLEISKQSRYLGDTNVEGGSLVIVNNDVLPLNSLLTLTQGTLLDIGPFSQRLVRVRGAGEISMSGGTMTLQPTNDETFAGTVSGTGTLTKDGTGRLTVSGMSTFVGNTIVASGTLSTSAPEVLSDNSSVEVRQGASLSLNAFDETVANLDNSGSVDLANSTSSRFRINGNLVNRTNGRWTSGAQTIDVKGDVTNFGTIVLDGTTLRTENLQFSSGSMAGDGSLFIATSANLEAGILRVPITGTANITKSGTGVFRFEQANTYTGTTTIVAGELVLAANSALPTATMLRIQQAGILRTVATQQTVRAIETEGLFDLSGEGSEWRVTETLTSSEAGRLNLGASRITLRGDWNTQGVVEAGSSTVDFAGDIGALQRVVFRQSNPLRFFRLVHSGASQVLMAGPISVAENLQKTGAGILDLGGNLLNVRKLTLAGGVIRGASGSQITTTNSSLDLQIGTVDVPIVGAASIDKTTEGEVVLRSTVSVTNEANIRSGTLKTETSSSAFIVGGQLSIEPAAQLQVEDGSVELFSLLSNQGSIHLLGGELTLAGASVPQTLELTEGSLSGSGTIVTRGLVEKVISGSSSFAGNIRVEASSTSVNAALPNASLQVSAGATLQGNSTLKSLDIGDGGVVRPGNSPGSIVVEQLNLNEGGRLQLEIGGASVGQSYDQVIVRDQAKLNGWIDVSLIDGFRPQPSDVFDLITFSAKSGNQSVVLPLINGLHVLQEQEHPNAYRLTGISLAPVVTIPTTEPGEASEPTAEIVTEASAPKAMMWVSATAKTQESDFPLEEIDQDLSPVDVPWFDAPFDPSDLTTLPDGDIQSSQALLDAIYSAGFSLDLMSLTADADPKQNTKEGGDNDGNSASTPESQPLTLNFQKPSMPKSHDTHGGDEIVTLSESPSESGASLPYTMAITGSLLSLVGSLVSFVSIIRTIRYRRHRRSMDSCISTPSIGIGQIQTHDSSLSSNPEPSSMEGSPK